MVEDRTADKEKAFFGFNAVEAAKKTQLVQALFSKVAPSYDRMNDAMSLGLHRLWKRQLLWQMDIQPHYQVLDVAAGSGDLSVLAAKKIQTGKVFVTDINQDMLQLAKSTIADAGLISCCDFSLQDAHALSFPDNHFDCVMCGFGLRNTTHLDQVLSAFHRVLKPGGSVWVLEFSKVTNALASQLYDQYARFIPTLGKWLASDDASYQYLMESIALHPDQETLQQMFAEAGFRRTQYKNLNLGVVAIHSGWKT